jgi:hypothetical protein
MPSKGLDTPAPAMGHFSLFTGGYKHPRSHVYIPYFTGYQFNKIYGSNIRYNLGSLLNPKFYCMTISRINPLLRSICITVLFSSLIAACCDCDKTASTASVPGSGKKDTIPAGLQFQTATFKHFVALAPPRRIPNPDLERGSRFNREFPVLRSGGQFVNGFMFDPRDFTDVTGLKPASLFFQIAVTNSEDSVGLRNRTIVPSYTIAVIPLNSDNTQMKDPKTGELVAFDFTCPCPANASCCPKQ